MVVVFNLNSEWDISRIETRNYGHNNLKKLLFLPQFKNELRINKCSNLNEHVKKEINELI